MNPKIDPADFFQRFSTRVLWHFTGYKKDEAAAFGILNAILQSNTIQIGKESESVVMDGGKRRYGYPVACMCDIPFRDLRIHMLRYGQFGIAFHKQAALTFGHFNPVFYVHREHVVFKRASALLDKMDTGIDPKSELFRNLEDFLLAIGSYVKRSDLSRAIELNPEIDFAQDNNFYYEREWRAIFPWKFQDNSIAAIMMPEKFRKEFHAKWGNRFDSSSIVSSEMVEVL